MFSSNDQQCYPADHAMFLAWLQWLQCSAKLLDVDKPVVLCQKKINELKIGSVKIDRYRMMLDDTGSK